MHASIQVDGRLDWRSTSVTMDGQERRTNQARGAGQAGSCNSREGGARENVTEESRPNPPLGAESDAGVLPALHAGEHTLYYPSHTGRLFLRACSSQAGATSTATTRCPGTGGMTTTCSNATSTLALDSEHEDLRGGVVDVHYNCMLGTG